MNVGKNGYVTVTGTGHPLAWGRQLTVGAHRIKLWKKIGPGPHACHWCGCTVVWVPTKTPLPDGVHRLVVDHVDEDRSNNDPSNLVPACNPCNTLRSTPMAGRRRKPHVSRSKGPAQPFPEPMATGVDLGPPRHVRRELSYDESGVGPSDDHLVTYELVCGHLVTRRFRGNAICFCEQCPGTGSWMDDAIHALLKMRPSATLEELARAAYPNEDSTRLSIRNRVAGRLSKMKAAGRVRRDASGGWEAI